MKFHNRLGLSIVFFVALFSTPIRAEEKPALAGIVMQIDALATNSGFVFCALYERDIGFPGEPAQARANVKVRPEREQAACAFPEVKAGRYAAAIWHDVNDDQKLDTNWVGMPTEPVGASNNAKGKFGPPKFQDAAFVYKPPLLKQNIRLE